MAEVKVTFLTTEKVATYLDRAVETGLYGLTRADAAERMVASFIEDMITNAQIREIGVETDEED